MVNIWLNLSYKLKFHVESTHNGMNQSQRIKIYLQLLSRRLEMRTFCALIGEKAILGYTVSTTVEFAIILVFVKRMLPLVQQLGYKYILLKLIFFNVDVARFKHCCTVGAPMFWRACTTMRASLGHLNIFSGIFYLLKSRY